MSAIGCKGMPIMILFDIPQSTSVLYIFYFIVKKVFLALQLRIILSLLCSKYTPKR